MLNALTQTVRRFVRERLLPAEARVERGGCDPLRTYRRDARAGAVRHVDPGGVWRARPDDGRGGAGRPGTRLRVAGIPLGDRHQQRHRLARASSSTAPTRRSSIGCRAWRAGRSIGSFALTEPDVGSDAGSIDDRGAARRRPLRAQRHQALHHQARWPMCSPSWRARGRPVRRNHRVPRPERQSGPDLGAIDKKMGQRGTRTCDVIFDDCRVARRCRASAASRAGGSRRR